MKKNLKYLDTLPDGALAVIARGSHIYGTANEQSDVDMYAIYPDYIEFCGYYDDVPAEVTVSFDGGETFDIQMVHKGYIVEHLYQNDLAILELMWQNETEYDFNYAGFHEVFDPMLGDCYDAWKLRQWTSKHCNNSWAKCHKKLTVSKDYSPYIGRKSIWHVFRMYDYAAQILQHGKIVQYNKPELISLYDEIVKSDMDWDALKARYQEKRNEAASLLRTFVDKPINQ